MDVSWDDARIFLAVVEQGSLSGAARHLGVAQPTISRRLAALEATLGEALFARGVGGAVLTPYGERLVVPAKRMAEGAAELSRVAEGRDVSLEGSVRITAPPGVAFDFVAPFAAAMRAKLPGLHLEVVATTRYVDLSRREADLALRLKKPDQRDLTCVATVRDEAVPFVARAVAERLGPSPKPADVDWIAWAPPLDELQPNAMLQKMIPGFRPSFASDDFLVQLRAAEVGLGAMFLGRAKHRFARETTLVPIRVQGIPPVSSALHLVGATRALEIPRVRAVAEMLRAEFAKVRLTKSA